MHSPGAYSPACEYDDDYSLNAKDKEVLNFVLNSCEDAIVVSINDIEIPVKTLMGMATDKKDWISNKDGWMLDDVSVFYLCFCFALHAICYNAAFYFTYCTS